MRLILIWLLFERQTLAGQFPPSFDHGVDLSTTRPLIIAHAGFEGRYPEHTVFGYEQSVIAGADVIECDMSLSKDLHVICAHESALTKVTNVADVYPESRMNTYFIVDKWENVTDYFSVDFTLDELKLIKKRQDFSFRDPNYDDMFPIATLEECIQVAKRSNHTIGLHLETKERTWLNSLDILQQANTTFEDLILEILEKYSYTSSTDPCFLQSFSRQSLEYFKEKTSLPLVYLLTEYNDISNASLQEISQFAYGIGPNKRLIVPTNEQNQITERTDLISRAHAYGLRVHPFTMDNENHRLAWDYGQDPYNEYKDFLDLQADGVFSNFPDTYKAFLDWTYEC